MIQKSEIDKPVDIQISIESLEQTTVKAAVLLAEAAGLGTGKVKGAMKKGAVWISRGKKHRRIRRADSRLKVGDTLAMYYNERILSQPILPCLLLKNYGDFSIWFKPSGVLSKGSRWGDHLTIQRYVETYFDEPKPAFIVHRLDRAASGIMLIAHGKSAAAQLSALFEHRNIKKVYWAWVKGDARPYAEPFKIDLPVDGKESLSFIRCLDYEKSQRYGDISLVEVNIATGRKHQIRQHLNALQLPIVGDRLYGHAQKDDVDLQLRSTAIAFQNPFDHQAIAFELPENLQLHVPEL